MGTKPVVDYDITVVWQSLVVPAYRRFFSELARHNSGNINLVAPSRFRELGSQWLKCPANDDSNYALYILPVWFWHVQIVFFRGFTRLWRRLCERSSGREKILVCLAEPYSFTALFIYLQTVLSGRRPDYFILYGLQNIDKKHPLILRLVQSFLFKRVTHILYTGDEQDYVLGRQGYTGATLPFPLWFDERTFFVREERGREKFKSLDAGAVWLGYAGSLLPEKGLEDLFVALAKLDHSLQKRTCLLVAGQGPQVEWVRDSLQKLERFGISTLYLGALSPERMNIFYNAIDLLVVPSRTTSFWKEQFGRVIVEAEACGATALGSNSGAVPEVIGDAERIFNERDPDGLSAILAGHISRWSEFSLSESNRQRDGMRARALSRYGDKKLAERFAKKLAEI